MREPEHIEMLINPVERLLAIRPCVENHPNAIRWTKKTEGKVSMRDISSASFVSMLMDLMGWNRDYRYCIRGYARATDQLAVMFFDLYEPEVHIRLVEKAGTVRKLKGYPAEWAGTFGLSAYEQFNNTRMPEEDLLGLDAIGHPVDLHGIPPYTQEDVRTIVQKIKEEGMGEG